MITLEKEFQTNANATGLQTFVQLKQGSFTVINRRTKEARQQNVYIYLRMKKDQTPFGWEVVCPLTKKAGTYKLPTPKGEEQKYITYPEDQEDYPGAAAFGFRGWFYNSEHGAESKFDELLKETADEEAEAITVPSGEFTVKEYAEQMGLAYVDVSNWVKGQVEAGKIKLIRTERRHKIGRATNIFAPA